MTENGYEWRLDPNDVFLDQRGRVTPIDLVGMLGILPTFLVKDSPHALQVQMSEGYQFGLHFTGIESYEIHEDGSYHYPGDPLQHPIALVRHPLNPNDEMFVYQHAFVMFRTTFDGEVQHAICRMD